MGCSDDSGDQPIAQVRTPEAAAQRLFDAWGDGDETTALTVADELVVDTLFEMEFSDGLAFGGCPGEADTWYCTYENAAREVVFFVRPTNDGPRVYSMSAS
jgi:hypothetical protein